MKRCIVNVATQRFVPGQQRLRRSFSDETVLCWTNAYPPGSPQHHENPYAFKAHGIKAAQDAGYDLVLWADACILPHGSIEPLWDRIAECGYWISNNGFRNSEWTCKEAYPLLGVTEGENRQIPHVVATTFGLNLRSEVGAAAFAEYFRLAQNGSFRGPWTGGVGVQHRHDQTALSVVAYRLGMVLTNPPAWFSYRGGETAETVLIADGAY